MRKKDKSDRQTHERHKIERHCVVLYSVYNTICIKCDGDNGDVVDDDNGWM